MWELAPHRSIAIDRIAGRGLEPAKRETCGNGVRKASYRDPEGNEIGFGGAPGADEHVVRR